MPANTAIYLKSNGILPRLVFFYQGYSNVKTYRYIAVLRLQSITNWSREYFCFVFCLRLQSSF